jgi:predicted dehydrogenase
VSVALVGLGYWGSKLLRNLVALTRPADVVAVDCVAERLTAAVRTHSGLRTATRMEAALADDRVAAILIATPSATHAALARQALLAGRHVFIEKPMATSSIDASELAELAERRRLTLMVGHTFLFSPRLQYLADHLRMGSMGRIHHVASSRLNLRRGDINVLWDLAPHDFSIIFHLLEEFPLCVQSTVRTVLHPGVPDVAFVNLTFPSGIIASVTVSWLVPRKVRSTVIVGERGMIVYDDTDADEPVRIYCRGTTVPESPDFADNQLTHRYGDTIAPYVPTWEPLRAMISHFLACAAGRDTCRSDAWSGTRVVAAVEAADQSWRQGGAPVAIGEEVLVVGTPVAPAGHLAAAP